MSILFYTAKLQLGSTGAGYLGYRRLPMKLGPGPDIEEQLVRWS
jgi:hypothetical protein